MPFPLHESDQAICLISRIQLTQLLLTYPTHVGGIIGWAMPALPPSPYSIVVALVPPLTHYSALETWDLALLA